MPILKNNFYCIFFYRNIEEIMAAKGENIRSQLTEDDMLEISSLDTDTPSDEKTWWFTLSGPFASFITSIKSKRLKTYSAYMKKLDYPNPLNLFLEVGEHVFIKSKSMYHWIPDWSYWMDKTFSSKIISCSMISDWNCFEEMKSTVYTVSSNLSQVRILGRVRSLAAQRVVHNTF